MKNVRYVSAMKKCLDVTLVLLLPTQIMYFLLSTVILFFLQIRDDN